MYKVKNIGVLLLMLSVESGIWASRASSVAPEADEVKVWGYLSSAEQAYFLHDDEEAEKMLGAINFLQSLPPGTEIVTKYLSQLINESKSGDRPQETALEYYTALAEGPIVWQAARANKILGSMYYAGVFGVAKNLVTAEEYYQKAAQQNDNKIAAAKAYLGFSRSFDEATDVEVAKKYVPYIYKAAEQSEDMFVKISACALLGRMYYFGQAIVADPQEALKYLEIAFNQNISDVAKIKALAILARMYSLQDPHAQHPDYMQLLLKLKPSIPFEPESDVFLGSLYYSGDILPKNNAMALDFLKKAANQLIDARVRAEASALLGEIYVEGDAPDYQQAHKYLQIAAEQDVNLEAQAEGYVGLGILYYHGYAVQKNYREALRYLVAIIKQEVQAISGVALIQALSYVEAIAQQKEDMIAYVWAHRELARLYERGRGNLIKKDAEKFFNHLVAVAEQDADKEEQAEALKSLKEFAETSKDETIRQRAHAYVLEDFRKRYNKGLGAKSVTQEQ